MRKASGWARIWLAIGVCALLAAVVAGTTQGKPSGQTAPRGTVSLFGWSVGRVEEQLVRSVVRAFERRHRSINVNYDSSPNYDQTMLARFSARRPPTVFYLNSEKAPT